MKHAWMLSAALAFVGFHAQAETLNLEYKTFYSHVKQLDDEEMADLQFAFGFVRVGEDRLCTINHAEIVTQKQTLPITVTAENRFSVPTDKILKMAEAQVVVDLDEPANVCDMSVQIETKPDALKQSYSHEELVQIEAQYKAFFDEMGGFMSFMMPDVIGLKFHFDDHTLNESIAPNVSIEGGELSLSDDWMSQGLTLTLPEKPFRITAVVEK